jgi:SPP1 family predicted phage head-tail adaptor
MPSIGNLDRRIIIEREVEQSRNAVNEPVTAWIELATVSAQRRDASDGEMRDAGQIASNLTSRFVIRNGGPAATVNPKDRINYSGAYWNILGVKETLDGRFRFLEITAVRRTD